MFIKKYSKTPQTTNKLLNKTFFFLIIINKQTKIKQKNNTPSLPKQTKIKQNNPCFFSFSYFAPTKVYHLPFSSFLLLLLPSLFSLSLSLSLSLFIYFTLNTHLNSECSGPKLTINIIFLFNLIILQNNLVLVN